VITQFDTDKNNNVNSEVLDIYHHSSSE
jgi:hypothetical protein